MKKCTIYASLLVIVAGFFAFYAGSCSTGSDYYIRFKANGEEVEFGLGLTDYESNAFANAYGDPVHSTLFIATPETAESSSLPATYIYLHINGVETDTYTFGDDASLYYVDSSTGYYVLSGSINVTRYGAVGETIEGTFEAILAESMPEGMNARAAAPDITITDGEFKVKRIADNTYVPIGAN
jgi:hypothetical protein